MLVIIFTCSHCPTAQAYEERVKQLATDYKDRGVAVVAVSPNDPAAVWLDELSYSDLGDLLDEMKTRARDHDFNFTYLCDTHGTHHTFAKVPQDRIPVATSQLYDVHGYEPKMLVSDSYWQDFRDMLPSLADPNVGWQWLLERPAESAVY